MVEHYLVIFWRWLSSDFDEFVDYPPEECGRQSDSSSHNAKDQPNCRLGNNMSFKTSILYFPVVSLSARDGSHGRSFGPKDVQV